MQPKILSMSIDDVKLSVTYNPGTGHFKRLNGRRAGSVNKNGYRVLKIGGRTGLLVYEHRLAFFYMTGRWPQDEVDHINGNRADNRWSNLRLATKSQNMMNVRSFSHNTSGVKGVSFSSSDDKWMAYIQAGNRITYLGKFDRKDDAVAARKHAEKRVHADYAWAGAAQ